MLDGLPSVTVIVWDTSLLLPSSSFAVHVRVVAPTGNVPLYDTLPSVPIVTLLAVPSLTLSVNVAAQLSVTVKLIVLLTDLPSHETSSISLIPLITGFSLSSTVTVCLHSLLLPFTSVTVQRTVCAPLSNVAV